MENVLFFLSMQNLTVVGLWQIDGMLIPHAHSTINLMAGWLKTESSRLADSTPIVDRILSEWLR